MRTREEFSIGDDVEILTGPFRDHRVRVIEINGNMATVMLKLFNTGREMPMALETMSKVAKIRPWTKAGDLAATPEPRVTQAVEMPTAGIVSKDQGSLRRAFSILEPLSDGCVVSDPNKLGSAAMNRNFIIGIVFVVVIAVLAVVMFSVTDNVTSVDTSNSPPTLDAGEPSVEPDVMPDAPPTTTS